MQRSATCIGAATLLVGLILAPVARAYDVPAKLNEVALHYSLGVGEMRCASPAEWDADGYSRSYWAYSNVRRDYAVLAPLICDGALDVANTELPAWQRAVGTLVLVHEAFHLRHWRFRRDEGKVECQAMVYFTDAAQKLGASEAESNNLYPYALAWHRRQVELLPWYGDPKCVLPPWIPPSYLVETFLARGHAGEREARERRARAVADQLTRAGMSVRFGGTIHIPEDEICFVVFDAASGRTAALAATRAELDAFRIVEAVMSRKESA